jgi:histidine triad (HIT) family protein
MEQDCLFCRIAQGDVPAARVLENEWVIAIHDAHPQAPVHLLVIPKRHVAGLPALPPDDALWNRLLDAVQRVAAEAGLDHGFRVVVNTGDDGGQTVGHLHVHVLGGRAMGWPPG